MSVPTEPAETEAWPGSGPGFAEASQSGRAPAESGPVQPSAGALVLRVLRIGLHTGFAGLLAFAVVLTLINAPHAPLSWLALLLGILLAGVYLAGTIVEKRHSTTGTGPDPRRYGAAWLALVTVLWVALVAVSGNFVWLAFPLFFLHLHVLKTAHAVFAVAMLTGVVILSQWWHNGQLEPAMLIGPMVGAVFAVFMAMAYRALYLDGENQRRALAELRRTRAELAQSQHDAGVLAERGRLAREIHDTLAQGLSSIVLVSRGAVSALDAGDTATAAERIRLAQSTASENLAEARRFIRGLSSPQLEPREDGASALADGLARLCSATERHAAARGDQLRCRFNLDGDSVWLPAPYEVTLLRAAQASLANVLAHAKARTAVVTLGFLDEDVTLDIYDDGVGFDPSKYDGGTGLGSSAVTGDGERDSDGGGGGGFGLLTLRERVAALNGRLDLESAPGEGTVVAIRLPLRTGTGEERE
ncbi:sensor histidine kinase [Crystallibacter degradans]|uniref:sensor histidine kinase n=1 Tax=Crystallibacter degradans TaxID=2726743 RepID=UPI00147629C6|nr:sensor histidine kinase [Arthrobacter sp. SF27]NMR30578.1 sensor histidine kinase [Arthrobacter sp. SF27]